MKVLLYHDWPLAKDYLQPVETAIKIKHPDWEVYHGGHRKPFENQPYDWVVTCDELSAGRGKAKRTLCIFHGLASKGQAFSTARREAFVNTDAIFAVPGARYATVLREMGVPEDRVYVTGLTKLNGFKRNILFAPTHNPTLSAIPVIQNKIYQLDNVRVRLHMWTSTSEKDNHQKFRGYYPVVSNETSESDLRWADVVIGDFGSILIEAIALGKQTFQVINPQWEEWYLAKGLARAEIINLPEVWYPKRYATQVHSFDDLYDALNIMPLGNSANRVLEIMERTKI